MDSLSGVRTRSGSIDAQRLSTELPSQRRGLGREDGGLTRSGNLQVKHAERRASIDFSSLPSKATKTGGTQARERAVSVVQQRAPDAPPPKSDAGPKGLLARITYSMKKLFAGKEHVIDKSGVRFGDQDRGRQIGGYIVQGDKRKGVEPGFVAKKAWMPKDENNMVGNPGHKFYQAANRSLDARMRHDLQNNGPLEDEAFDFMMANHRDAFNRYQGTGDGGTLEEFMTDPLHRDIRNQFFDHLKTTDPQIAQSLRDEIMASEPKFQKNHYVKLDYVETDRTRGGDVRLPEDKAKGWMHRMLKTQTPDEVNRGAVKEAAYNDLMRDMGVHSQKLKLVMSKYDTGEPKIMLDSTHVSGPNGEAFDDFDGSLRNGYLVKIDRAATRAHKDHWEGEMARHPEGSRAWKQCKARSRETIPERDQNGRFVLDDTMEKLGRNKLKMLRMGDRDALGSTGGNKGRAGNTFVGIDPGHAGETDRMRRRGDVNSDGSLNGSAAKAGWLAKKFGADMSYKNFTMFDQQPLSEIIQGARDMQALKDSGGDTRIFADYAQGFDGTAEHGLDYQEEMEALKTADAGRRDYILGVFAERLAVDKFDFAGGVQLTPDQQLAMSNRTLDTLDALEKITSRTSDLSPDGTVQLQRPRVTDRREWHIQQSSATKDIHMSFSGSKSEAREAMRSLGAFIDRSDSLKLLRDEGMIELRATPNGKGVEFVVKAEAGDVAKVIDMLSREMANDKVMAFKHPRA
ncbi:MAG TPA: hypothetical protein PKA13_20650 [Geminicoccaceae bacterium]|nr:hypothetical protein [Geminicoccus sp.]HMU52200.1 hypothetical protein [Geminicoccaceae bacterium]